MAKEENRCWMTDDVLMFSSENFSPFGCLEYSLDAKSSSLQGLCVLCFKTRNQKKKGFEIFLVLYFQKIIKNGNRSIGKNHGLQIDKIIS